MLDKTDPARTDTGETSPCVGELPEFYKGTQLTVDALKAAATDLNGTLKELIEMHTSRRAVPLKVTAEGVERFANQINILAGVLKRKTAEHINRRGRHD